MPSKDVCRLCLADMPGRVISCSPLQDIYEKLTDCPLNSSGKPMVACHMCYYQLKKCRDLMITSMRADQLLTQILKSGLVVNQKSVNLIDRKEYKLDHSLSITPTEITEFITPVQVKEEPVSYDNIKTDKECIHNIKSESSDFANDGLESCNIINEGVIYNETCEGYAILNAIDIMDVKHEELVRIARQQTYDDPTDNNQEIHTKIQDMVLSENQTLKEEPTLKANLKSHSSQKSKRDNNNHPIKSRFNEKNISEREEIDKSTNSDGYSIEENNQEIYICDFCNVTLANKNDLIKHIKKHNVKVKCYPCTICHNIYDNKRQLSRHVMSHSKSYDCPTCHKKFGIKCNFKRHLRTHTKEKPFQCKVCSRRFYTKCHLDQHAITHTGEKPFKCKICNMRFNRRNNLKTHMNEHNEDKPFKCNVCGKDFKRKGNLNEHLRVHTGEKPFNCELCGVAFAYKHMLKNHMKLHDKCGE